MRAIPGIYQSVPATLVRESLIDEVRRGKTARSGGTLPERFQHTGYLETYIVARNPKLDLVFRNLAVSGDEIAMRHRSENFGTPDDWLTRVGADVIFAFFGFNESFKGPEGLE